MRVGLTYDLRRDWIELGYSEEETAEFDRPDTVEAIEGALRSHGYETDRIGNIRTLVKRLYAGDRWDVVFNIAEGMHGYGREAQVPALLDAYEIPHTFSDASVLTLCLRKELAKRVLRDCGLPTPLFALVTKPTDVEGIGLSYPLFVKPVAEGTAKGITARSRVNTPEELKEQALSVLERFRQPVLVEEFLPGRELTVGVVGTGTRARVVGTLEVHYTEKAEQDIYTYTNKEKSEELLEYGLATDARARDAERISLEAWRALGCRDAGRIDLRLDATGEPSIIEINPLAGLHPAHSDLPILCAKAGMSYEQLIGHIMESARQRISGADTR